jgi:hypothetical protein
VVVDEQGNEDESKPLLWSERTSLLTKCLTEPTLLEMYENTVSRELAREKGSFCTPSGQRNVATYRSVGYGGRYFYGKLSSAPHTAISQVARIQDTSDHFFCRRLF